MTRTVPDAPRSRRGRPASSASARGQSASGALASAHSRATDNGVPPARARWRAFAGKALAIAAYLAVMGGSVLAGRAGWLSEGAFIPLSLLPTALILCLPGLDAQMGNAEITRTRLTVYTMTGRRTLDLTALHRVRRFVLLSKGPKDIDLLFVTDARGVRAGIVSAEAVVAIARSVTPKTRVSRRARQRLNHGPFTLLAVLTDLLLPALFGGALLLLLPAIAATVAYGW